MIYGLSEVGLGWVSLERFPESWAAWVRHRESAAVFLWVPGVRHPLWNTGAEGPWLTALLMVFDFMMV